MHKILLKTKKIANNANYERLTKNQPKFKWKVLKNIDMISIHHNYTKLIKKKNLKILKI